MLTQMDVTNSRGNVLSFLLEELEGPYQVQSIEGLDPGKASLVSSNFVGADGEQFQSAKRGARNIKIRLDLDPDFNPKGYAEVRRDLYTHFMPKSKVTLRFYLTTGLYLDIVGIVEYMTTPLFAEDPDVEISIMCYDPDFVDGRMVTVNGMSVNNSTNTVVEYPGTVESGSVITINFNRAVSEFTIYNIDEGGNLRQLDFSGTLLDGDQLVISSIAGNKGITLTRDSVSSSYLYGRSAQSSWISFVEGTNHFRVYAEGDPIPYVLEYVVRYGGL
jgi:hypothetical protein